MTRWQPDSRGRLERAALDLYAERGFDETTVAEIAARAGLTERTFFRYFADKREVLFSGAGVFEDLLVGAVASAPESAAPIDAIAAALDVAAETLQDRREFAGRRRRIIAASAELRERELIKMASLSAALAAALRRRGVEDAAAGLTAEAGVAVFRVAFERWIADGAQESFRHVIRESLDQLRVLTAGS